MKVVNAASHCAVPDDRHDSKSVRSLIAVTAHYVVSIFLVGFYFVVLGARGRLNFAASLRRSSDDGTPYVYDEQGPRLHPDLRSRATNAAYDVLIPADLGASMP